MKKDRVYIDGVLVGWTETVEDVRVGKHSWGAIYDGKKISQIALDLDNPTLPHADITEYGDIDDSGLVQLDITGNGTLDIWEMFLEDVLGHIKKLNKQGKKNG